MDQVPLLAGQARCAWCRRLMHWVAEVVMSSALDSEELEPTDGTSAAYLANCAC